MEKREYTVNELFENQILNDIYETRGDGLQCLYIRMYGKTEEMTEVEKSKKELENLMYELVKDKKKQKELWLKLDRFEGAMSGESSFWNKQYYKLGFLDRIYLKKEIADNKRKFVADNTGELEDTLIYKSMCFIKEMLGTNLWNIKKYKEIVHKMSKIKEEYPNVKEFIERNEIVNFSKKEVKALSEYLKLADDMQDIEFIETFKLGLKDSSLL